MKVSRVHALRGPNLWSQRTSIEAIVTCSSEEFTPDEIPEFIARLNERLPGVALLQSGQYPASVSMAHMLEIVTIALQKRGGCSVNFGHTVQT